MVNGKWYEHYRTGIKIPKILPLMEEINTGKWVKKWGMVMPH